MAMFPAIRDCAKRMHGPHMAGKEVGLVINISTGTPHMQHGDRPEKGQQVVLPCSAKRTEVKERQVHDLRKKAPKPPGSVDRTAVCL